MTRDAQATGGQEKEKEENEEKEIKFVQLGDDEKANNLSGAQKQALQRRLALMLENSAPRPRKQQQRGMPNGNAHGASETGEETAHKSSTAKRSVTNAHLEKSLQATRPSVPAEEQRRLRRIYSEFAGERDGKFPSGEASQKIGARESLM